MNNQLKEIKKDDYGSGIAKLQPLKGLGIMSNLIQKESRKKQRIVHRKLNRVINNL